MPATRPKYVAAVDFHHGSDRYRAGDPVTSPRVLDAVLKHGDRFVTRTTRKTSPAPAEDPTTTPDTED